MGSILIGTAVAVLIGRVSVSSRLLGWSAVAASAAALLMVVDFELANGGGFGLSLAKDTFDEGVDLDTLLTGLQLALGTFWVAALRQRSPQEPISNSRRTSLRLVLRSVFSLRHPTIKGAGQPPRPRRKLLWAARPARRPRAAAHNRGARPAPAPSRR